MDLGVLQPGRRPCCCFWPGTSLVSACGIPPTDGSRPGPLARACEILAQRPLLAAQIDEALRILREQRELANSPEVQRLLSLAYEAQDNRLRALGHLYAARQLGGSALEQARSELALAQLLSRLGHAKEACLTARLLLSRPATDIGRGAQALIETEHCPQSAAFSSTTTRVPRRAD